MPVITLPPVPNPPPPSVARVKPDGTPTQAQIEFETAMKTFLSTVKRAMEAM